jgi:N-acetylneuraminate synthase
MTSLTSIGQDSFSIGPIEIPNRVFIVGEIGINHNGDLDTAKQLIDMAKTAGFDAVKFQKRTIDIVYTQEVLEQLRESPWGTTQREQKEGLEFSEKDYDEIDAYCKSADIEWFASAWDIPSQIFLRKYKCNYNKVASAMLTHTPLLKIIADDGLMTFISTGMSNFEDIDRAVEIFKEADCPFVLLHTMSTYPSKEEDLNLRCMLTLRDKYNCKVGYSGHESSVSPSVVAAAMGACVIERHITLNRALYGSDQAASLESLGFTQLVAIIRKIPNVMGDGQKKFSEAEQSVADKLRYWSQDDLDAIK